MVRLHDQGDGPGSLGAYRNSPALRETALAARHPANTGWRRDLSISHERIGDVLRSQGDGSGALVAYRTSVPMHPARLDSKCAQAILHRPDNARRHPVRVRMRVDQLPRDPIRRAAHAECHFQCIALASDLFSQKGLGFNPLHASHRHRRTTRGRRHAGVTTALRFA